MEALFFGNGIAHSILLFAVVIGLGLYLGRFKVKGISLGSTWVLFIGIILSHFGLRCDAGILHFVKEFGLILFVFSIGLQVGPGFFHSFKSGGVKMNLLAAMNILLAVAVTWSISAVSGEDLTGHGLLQVQERAHEGRLSRAVFSHLQWKQTSSPHWARPMNSKQAGLLPSMMYLFTRPSSTRFSSWR